MQRVARGWGVPFGIGVGYGLVASLVGVAQWVLTQRDLAERLAKFRYVQCKYPYACDGTADGTNALNGNELFWLRTILVAAVVMLVLCWLAAFTASRTSQHGRDSMVAGLVAAAVSGAMYVAAAALVVAMSPAPGMTSTNVPCVLPFGIVFFGTAIVLAPAGAGMGARAGESLSRRRRAV